MSGKPIIFSEPMVRALLDGRKTQTRRVFKPQPPEPVRTIRDGRSILDGHGFGISKHSPYAPGDRLWVRERFAVSGIGWGKKPRYARGGRVHYHADPDHGWHDYWGKWHPSIHMPRWASRLTLTATDVRVQRLQEISADDIYAEGTPGAWDYQGKHSCLVACRDAFCNLWNSLHGPDAWEANPWVVALTFDVHRCNIDEMAT